MKRAGLQSSRKQFGFAIMVAILFAFNIPAPALAGPIGNAPCVQTIDSTGGVSVYRSGNTCLIAFKSVQSYSWTPPTGVNSVNLLIVAGGGGGGSRHAGGGGAGGVLNLSNIAITSNPIDISVGAGGSGGAAASTGGNTGSNGSNTVVSGTGITTRTAIGGGGGGYGAGTNSGGSGAGGGSSGAGGAGTSGQGNAGSAGGTNGSTFWVGGGGGGAGGAGETSTSTKGGNGGAGLELTWMSSDIYTNLGVSVLSNQKYYIGGGGGGGTDSNSFTGGSGGVGGGGAGSTGTGSVYNATTNSGGGGGGSGISGVGTGSFKGGDGGSGVVVLRYNIPSFTNSATFSIAENSSTTTNAATVSVSESSTITIRSTLDYSFFTVVTSDSVTARIRFISSPDFEALADIGANNEYDLSIRATNSAGNYQDFSIKITLTDVLEAATIASPTISGTIYKGREITISISTSTPGKVRFLVAGKKIPNCLYRPTSGSYPTYSATCSWKPSLSGTQLVKAIITPSDSAISPIASGASTVFISKRTTTR